MDLKEIRRIVQLVEGSNIEELEIHEKDIQIRVTKGKGIAGSQVMVQSTPVVQPIPVLTPGQEVPAQTPSPVPANDNLIEIHAPMVGTFYRAPAPDAEPYVKEGDMIQSGRVLCIIEAMKLMNEIEAEISGKIIKILAENAQPVEYNQPLFLVEKV